MNNLQIFKNKDFGKVRVVEVEGQPHFVASDVAKILGYRRPNDAISDHCRWAVKRRIPHPQCFFPNWTIEGLFKREAEETEGGT
jgi:Prophage antirepressor